MWKDVCHKCGRPIWNGIPKEEMEKEGYNTEKFIKQMESEGYTLGRNTTIVGTWGNMREIPCKPICSKCSNEVSKKKDEKEKKIAMRKVAKILKKQFSCPICELDSRKGYDTKIFKCDTKSEMITHIKEKYTTYDIKDVLPREDDY